MGLRAFEEKLDLLLIEQMKNLIVRVSDHSKNILSSDDLFGNEVPSEMMEASYGLRYPGEVLERYAERCGADMKVERSLAVAMAESARLLDKSMFVGGQLVRFLNHIRPYAEKDVYFAGALYLLTDREAERDQLRDRLLDWQIGRIEEIAYLLSVFRNERESRKILMQKLPVLLGKGRNIKVYGNEKLFAWLLSHCYETWKDLKGKAAELEKAFLDLPFHQVKEGGKTETVLMSYGYSDQEITFLNMTLPFLVILPQKLNKSSIIAERIAAAGVCKYLNAESVEDPCIFPMCLEFMDTYRKFDIKLDGSGGLSEYLEYRVHIKNPDLLLYLFVQPNHTGVCRRWFLVNLLDRKWDMLAEKLNREEYFRLFTACFEKHGCELVRAWVEKYECMTGRKYVDEFWQVYEYDYRTLFRLLILEGIIDISGLYRQYMEDKECLPAEKADLKWENMFEYLKNASEKLFCRDVYHLWDEIISKYGMQGLQQFLGRGMPIKNAVCFDASRYSRSANDSFWKGLDFLNEEETEKLFDWASEEIYRKEPGSYNEFLRVFLKKRAAGLFPREECIELINLLALDEQKNDWELEDLRKQYYSPEEWESYQKEKIRLKELEAKEREENELHAARTQYRERLLSAQSTNERYRALSEIINRQYSRSGPAFNACKEITEEEMSVSVIRATQKVLCMLIESLAGFVRLGGITISELKGMVNKMEVVEDGDTECEEED